MTEPAHIQAYDFLKNEANSYIADITNIKTQITNNNTFKPNDATRNNNVMVIPTTVNMQPGASTKQLCKSISFVALSVCCNTNIIAIIEFVSEFIIIGNKFISIFVIFVSSVFVL